MNICHKLRGSILLLLVAVWPVRLGHAGVIFDLTPAVLSTSAGGMVEFTGTLTNTSASNVFLNGTVGILPNTQLTLDDSPFFINSPLFLMPSESYVGPFFDVTADATALPGIYSGSFTIQGGVDADTFDNLATQIFTVNIVSSVPEPNSLPVLMVALAAAIIIKRQPRWRSFPFRRS
jgi:hypothetical protein